MNTPCKFFLLLLLSVFFISCSKNLPRIDSIDPSVGFLGEVVSIYGEHFGDERNESYITIGDYQPISSAYIEWKNDRILLQIPDFGDSGLIYIHKDGEKSNAALFSNRAIMPQIVRGTAPGTAPTISALNPSIGAVGSIITILGENFGTSRENSTVRFFWNVENPLSSSQESESHIEVSAAEFGYDAWSEREIRVRVPDGASSGNVIVETPRGSSRPVYFEVSGGPGTKVFKDKRSYTLSYSVDIRVNESSIPNALYLWMPTPVVSASQKIPELLARNKEPFVEDHLGTSLYQFNNLRADSSNNVSVSYQVDVYAVETSIRSQNIRPAAPSAMTSVFMSPSPLVPSNNAAIIERAQTIVGREQNPYLKAQRIYQWLIDANNNVQIELESAQRGGILEVLAEGSTDDAYRMSLLFCSLARASGVPALPVSGIAVDSYRNAQKHYWVEFWIDGIGWIPVDTVFGAGKGPTSITPRQDYSTFYFGSMDNQRIAFSRGETNLSKMDLSGRVVTREREYALQNLWEEAVGGLDSYSSLWTDIAITGMYVN
jgi:transglutaminase-like putative cysteine protease